MSNASAAITGLPVLGWLLLLGSFGMPATAQPVIDAPHDAVFQLQDISGGLFFASRITQMAWGPGPDPAKTYLYFSTSHLGVRRAEYDPASGALSGLVTINPDLDGNGLAFHGTVMYLSESYEAPGGRMGRIWRYRDDDADGDYEAAETRIAIVEGIPIHDHHVNQIRIVGDRLYVGIGTRTLNGAYECSAGDAYGESAYGGTICVIDDLTAVPDAANAAGFFPSQPDAATYEALIDGADPLASAPFTSTAPDKLRVFASGTRNPFGVAMDGAGRLWFTNNFQRTNNVVFDRDNILAAEPDASDGDGFTNDIHDQFFPVVFQADYGYRNSNWQSGNPAGNTHAVNAGFFLPGNRVASHTFDNADPLTSALHDPANPDGLGPHGSSDGFDFYAGNDLPPAYHHDAFIARWNPLVSDGPDTLNYGDLVTVDLDTAMVMRIATGFARPIDVLSDAAGNLLIAEWDAHVYRMSALAPHAGPHAFSWDRDADGDWSDRLAWNATLSADDRIAPDAWGSARYAVTIDRPGANPTVTADVDATVESIALSERLRLAPDRTLTVQDQLVVQFEGELLGEGVIVGDVVNHGLIAPGNSAGRLDIQGDVILHADGMIQLELGGVEPAASDRLVVTGTLALEGTLDLQYPSDFRPSAGQSFPLVTASSLTGTFPIVQGGDPGGGVLLEVQYQPDGITLLAIDKPCAADADNDGQVNVVDLLEMLGHWGACPPPCPGDSNGDGAVNVLDLLDLLGAWGSCG